MSIVPKLTKKNCVKLWFIDSFRFFVSGLDKLASFLSKNKLQILQHEFSNLSEENFNLLTQKDFFPYEYIDSKSWRSCVYRKSFYSSYSTEDTISENDYAHAVNVWQRFSIQTLGI